MRTGDIEEISYHEKERTTEDDIKYWKLYIKWHVEEKARQDAARAFSALAAYIESLIAKETVDDKE